MTYVGDGLMIVPELGNKYDENAVAIFKVQWSAGTVQAKPRMQVHRCTG